MFYWLVFGFYEPLLATGGALGALFYPEQVSRSHLARPLGIKLTVF
jgi:hypothetical protein